MIKFKKNYRYYADKLCKLGYKSIYTFTNSNFPDIIVFSPGENEGLIKTIVIDVIEKTYECYYNSGVCAPVTFDEVNILSKLINKL